MSSIILNANLLNRIEPKLKKSLDDVNLELSYSLNYQESYYVDFHLHYYLTQKTTNSNIMEYKVFKYLYNKSKTLHYNEKYSIKIHKYLINNGYTNLDYFLYNATKLSLNLKVIKFLIKKGADVNYFSHSPLENAINNGNLLIAKILIKNNAKVFMIFRNPSTDHVYSYYLSKINN